MGACGSQLSPEDQAEKGNDKKVDQALRDQQAADANISKVLLLGAGGSGKSTLFKQMISIYGKGFPESERKTYTNIIYNNVLTAMKTLCLHSSRYGEVWPLLRARAMPVTPSDAAADSFTAALNSCHIRSVSRGSPLLSACFQLL